MPQDYFNQYSKYYNLFYTDKDYTAEVEYVDSRIRLFSPQAKSIIEYGSGTGGHGLLLQRKGYQIEGVERSEEMARIAREKGFKCTVSDITKFESTSAFDVCLSLFHVISYINGNNDLISLFEKTRNLLNPRGIFMFDVWFTPAVLHQRPEVRIKKVESPELEATRIARPESDDTTNVVTVNYQVFAREKENDRYFEINEAHPMRHFSIPEVALLAERTGFRLLKAEEFLTGQTPSRNTWGVNFILQK
jgi:SAM-dependent methyltransferase